MWCARALSLPPSSTEAAEFRSSSRRSAWRAVSSGPWQRKHRSDSNGRIDSSNRTSRGRAWSDTASVSAATHRGAVIRHHRQPTATRRQCGRDLNGPTCILMRVVRASDLPSIIPTCGRPSYPFGREKTTLYDQFQLLYLSGWVLFATPARHDFAPDELRLFDQSPLVTKLSVEPGPRICRKTCTLF